MSEDEVGPGWWDEHVDGGLVKGWLWFSVDCECFQSQFSWIAVQKNE